MARQFVILPAGTSRLMGIGAGVSVTGIESAGTKMPTDHSDSATFSMGLA
jgi:hypothetical protein